MSPPRVTFNDEELTLTLIGVGAGWTFEQLGQLSLFDEAQVQFPSSWTEFQIKIATQVVQSTWRLHSGTYLEQSFQAGLAYKLADGGSGQMSVDTTLIQHLMRRPLVSMDGIFTIKLNGEATAHGYSGDFFIGLGVRGHF
jgi:hypothetical protein